MSWSIKLQGTPEEVVQALQEQSSNLTDYSKEEYDSALPHLVGLVKENYGIAGVKISARGYGNNGEKPYRNCNVTIQPIF